MKLAEIVRPKKDLPVRKSKLWGNLDIMELSEESLRGPADVVSVLNDAGEVIGEINREDLIYLAKRNQVTRFAKVLDYMDEGVVAIDDKGRIFYLNNAYSQILGIPRYKVIGKYMPQIETGALLNKVLETHESISKDKQLISSINKYVSMRIFPQFSGGAFAGAISIFKDVTELNTMNHEVQRMSDVIKEVTRKLDYQEAFKNLGIITQNSEFIKVLEVANIAAKTDVTVLIRGESGVGKEVMAKLLHSGSNRNNSPLITVNCAAIPEHLFESELFGYEAGSFTGASKSGKIGKFQLADQGTLFLDEIGDLPLPMQAKLLRVLQQGEIEKIGSANAIPVDVRIITATNKPLEDLMKAEKFREDLFFRLNVISLNIPPLRERKEDIPLLANHFLGIYNKRYKKSLTISAEEYSDMMQYDWPGNIRQLQNYLERSVILGTATMGDMILKPENGATPDAGSHAAHPVDRSLSLKDQLKRCEKEIIEQTLREQNGDRQKTIEALKISRRTFYRRYGQLKQAP
ncbi:MAG: sigma 54-interacting transcriptional regulator [Fusobacteriaceae bacterium]|jgi:PAS domain S-box-containing protein|nr:sigma 54-interacting transcriptional regulator [Fusobacteriaceae bacterium]